MAGEEPDRWPRWNEPARKSDVVRALVFTRSCIVDVFVCLSALSRNDMTKFKKSLEDLSKNDDDLRKLIDDLGGKTGDE